MPPNPPEATGGHTGRCLGGQRQWERGICGRGFIGILKEGREEAGPAGLELASLHDFSSSGVERLSLAFTYLALG